MQHGNGGRRRERFRGRHLEEAYTCAVVDGALRRTTSSSPRRTPRVCPRPRTTGYQGELRGGKTETDPAGAASASADLRERVAEDLLDGDVAETFEGCEYWCQVYNGGRGLRFHFDKDEHAEDGRKVRVSYPIDRSHGRHWWRARQSPTIVVDQVYCGDSPEEEEEEVPRKTVPPNRCRTGPWPSTGGRARRAGLHERVVPPDTSCELLEREASGA